VLRLFANLFASACGAALVVWAFRSNAAWFERHVLPNYCALSPATHVFEWVARGAAAALGIALVVLFRPKLARWAARADGAAVAKTATRFVVPALLALVVCDGFLRWKEGRHSLATERGLPPMRIDETGNYAPVASSATEWDVEGRMIRYETDADGNRALRSTDVVDKSAPSILFAGESVAQGWGVAYEDGYAPIVARAMGLQSVNLSVTGFSNDQAYLRLREALPSFARPVAVVMLVLPVQLARSVSDRRQRLALDARGRLEIVPPSSSLFRTSPLVGLVPYHPDEAISLTRAILRATADAARERGVRALFVFTNFGPACLPDEGGTSRLERDLFDGLDVTHVRVDITPPLMILPPKEPHPNEKGHQAIAAAVLAALRGNAVAKP